MPPSVIIVVMVGIRPYSLAEHSYTAVQLLLSQKNAFPPAHVDK